MGYTTHFTGKILVSPPLNKAEISYLTKFNETRRMNRHKGPYFVDGSESFGQGRDADIIDYNGAPEGQPGLWCQWKPTEDGKYIVWDEGEKFYYSPEWMTYIIDHFLKPGAEASKSNYPEFEGFSFNHTLNGKIACEGEDSGDLWQLIVEDNVVSTVDVGQDIMAILYDGVDRS